MPEGADSVVIQEDTSLDGDKVRFNELPVLGENVRPKGQDISKDDIVLEAGHRLRSQDLGLIASVGISEVQVFKPLTISIMSTGDELVEPPGELRPGQIYNSNRDALAKVLQKRDKD